MTDVFISYKREDRESAKTLAKFLVSHGLDVWWDIELLAGQEFAEEINTVLNNAKSAIVLWTPGSVESDWVIAEASMAKQKQIIVPAILTETVLPLPFNTLHNYDLTRWNGQASDPILKGLLDNVRAVAGITKSDEILKSEAEINKKLKNPVDEVEYWKSIVNKQQISVSEFQLYIEKFGYSGIFADIAKSRIDELNNINASNSDSSLQPEDIPARINFRTLILVALGITLAVIIGSYWYSSLSESLSTDDEQNKVGTNPNSTINAGQCSAFFAEVFNRQNKTALYPRIKVLATHVVARNVGGHHAFSMSPDYDPGEGLTNEISKSKYAFYLIPQGVGSYQGDFVMNFPDRGNMDVDRTTLELDSDGSVKLWSDGWGRKVELLLDKQCYSGHGNKDFILTGYSRTQSHGVKVYSFLISPCRSNQGVCRN